jgi:hypothetical protein
LQTNQLNEVNLCKVVEEDKQMTWKSHGVGAIMLIHKFLHYMVSTVTVFLDSLLTIRKLFRNRHNSLTVYVICSLQVLFSRESIALDYDLLTNVFMVAQNKTEFLNYRMLIINLDITPFYHVTVLYWILSQIIAFFNFLFLDYFVYSEKYKKFWEELIAYFPLIWHRPHRERNNYVDTHRQTAVA